MRRNYRSDLTALFVSAIAATTAQAQTAPVAPSPIHSPTDISEQRTESEERIRISGIYFRFSLGGKTFAGYGPEFSFDKSLGRRVFVSGGLGQAYALTNQLGTLFTELDVSIWYSLIGTFAREHREWRADGTTFADYRDARRGGLRIGLGTQQYFFNASSGAIPFSGIAGKLMYELGLQWPFDIGIGVEAARLANAADKATATRAMMSLLWSFND